MPGAEITKIIDFDLGGGADDGDPNTQPNPGSYKSIQTKAGPTKAQDGKTKSESYAAKAKELGGNVHAIPGGGPKAARATSFNRVLTGFKISTKGAYKFTIALEAKGIRTTGSGKVTIRHRVNILRSNGDKIFIPGPTPGSTTVDPDTRLDDFTVTVDGKQNKLSTSSTVPDKGVTLGPDTYQLEVELQLIADAPVEGDARSEAEVEDATFSIELK